MLRRLEIELYFMDNNNDRNNCFIIINSVMIEVMYMYEPWYVHVQEYLM